MEFERCIDIGEEHVSRAILSRQAFRALLDRAAAVSRPEEGGPKVLVALARLATKECAWLEGDLRIELGGDDRRTTITVLNEMGYGYREKLFPDFAMNVPFDEFVRAVRLVPKLISPLLSMSKGGRLVLSATASLRKTSVPPPPIDIDEASIALMNPQIPKDAPAAPKPKERPSRRPTVARMAAVRPDVHSKPTVARMAAIRLEDMPQARREDQSDIDDAWTGDDDDKKKK
ncbi:MAG: hypothetical protein ACXWUG_13040 [Polyangiales bacterium]